MNRALVILTVVCVAAGPAVAQHWDREFAKLRDQVRQKQYDDALKLSEDLLRVAKAPERIREIYAQRARVLAELKRWDLMLAEAETFAGAAFAADRKLLAEVYADYAGRLVTGKKPRDAINVYRLLLANCPKQAERCAWARVGIGDCYNWHLKDSVAKAVPEYLAIERDYPRQTRVVATATWRAGEVYWRLKDYRNAADAYRKVAYVQKTHHPYHEIETAAIRVAQCHAFLEEWDRAIAAYREAEAKCITRANVKNDVARHRGDILFKQERFAEAAKEYQRVLSRYGVAGAGSCQHASRRLVECCAALKRYDDALKAAHICSINGDEGWVVPKIVEYLKLLDGNDTRVGQFVLYQLHGPGGPEGDEKLPDVLGDIGYPDYPADVQADFTKSLAALGNSPSELHRKGRACLYRGRPREAVPYLYEALLGSRDWELPKVGGLLVDGAVLGVQGTHAGRERWYRYLLHGPQGKDVDREVRALLVHKHPARDDRAKLNRVLAALERYITEPYQPGVNRRNETASRKVFIDAYARIAREKARTDDFVGLCRRLLAEAALADLYAHGISRACLCIRARDGHFAAEFRFLKTLTDPAKTPGLNRRARQAAKNELAKLNPISRWDKPFRSWVLDRYRPKKPKRNRK